MWAVISLLGVVSANNPCTNEDRVLWDNQNVEVGAEQRYSETCALCIVETLMCQGSCYQYVENGAKKVCEKCMHERCQPVFERCMGKKFFDLDFWTVSRAEHIAPVMAPVQPMSDKPAMPVVFMHGLGDSGSSPGVQSIGKSVSDAYPGTYVTCLDVADGMSSLTMKMDEQVALFTKAVQKDDNLKNGFNAVGISQGNLIIRAYIERSNNPPVHTFISMSGVHNGVTTCPDHILLRLICPFWASNPYNSPYVFSDYWKDALDKEKYLAQNRFLPNINNEGDHKNPSFASNLKSLKNYVLVEAMKDTVVRPRVSEQHGYLKWGEKPDGETELLVDTEAYKNDWLGLKTLKESNRLHRLQFDGDHVAWSDEFWNTKILPFLKPEEDVKTLLQREERKIMNLLKAQHVLPLAKPVAPVVQSGNPALPVVFMHGVGDSGSNPGMKSVCDSVTQAYPGTYVNCLNVANGAESLYEVLDAQLRDFVDAIRKDEKLKNGFNAVGFSQGNLVIRAYIERYNNPPVHTFVSMVGPHGGVGLCPDHLWSPIICALWLEHPYTAPVALADYWKDPANQQEYLKKSRFLADINNERATKNATYAANMKTLKSYVLVEALQETIVHPKASEHHGFYQWGTKPHSESDPPALELKDTEGYKGDWIGLKTLMERGRLHTLSYEGNHMRWSHEFWTKTILPFLAPASELFTVPNTPEVQVVSEIVA
eukprot:GEMP01008826.1.p1 GENE.GEMP01008826.1~~GEMP01008826.1.p1  ORF type:complete len:710 (+),score=163.91 GEMP01008826.1:60-2189(+)